MAEPHVPPIAYRPRDAAAVVGLSRARLYQLIANGELVTRKCGSSTLIPRSELERFVESLPIRQAE